MNITPLEADAIAAALGDNEEAYLIAASVLDGEEEDGCNPLTDKLLKRLSKHAEKCKA